MADQKWVRTSAGVKMPCIIYGTAWKKEQTVELVSKALRVGFRGVDTACQPKHYDEKLVGVALQRMGDEGVEREALYLQTKFTPLSGQDPENVPYDTAASLEEQVVQSFEVSKRNLQTTYVDSLLLHSPLASHELTMRAWRAMEIIQKAGGARQLGISNCYEMDVMMALYSDAEVKPAVLQNRFYKGSGYDVDLRHWCNNHGVSYQSFWSLTANPTVLNSDVIRALARSYKKTEAQIFFRYLIHSGITPLTGTSSEQHMREDLGIFDFELSSEEMNGITFLLK